MKSSIVTVSLKNKNIIFKIRRSKDTDYVALTKIILCVVSAIPLYVALVYINATITSSMRGSRKFFQRGSKFDNVF